MTTITKCAHFYLEQTLPRVRHFLVSDWRFISPTFLMAQTNSFLIFYIYCGEDLFKFSFFFSFYKRGLFTLVFY